MNTLLLVFMGLVGLSCSQLLASDDLMSHPSWTLLDRELCGYSRRNRIVGGKEARLGEYPWMALIGFELNGDEGYLCGGAILNRYYILTAAHCVDNPLVNKHMTIWTGEHNKNDYIDCEGPECAPPAQKRRVASITSHPEYNTSTNTKAVAMNDIAVLELAEPLRLNEFVHPICLPTPENIDFSGRKAHIAGWGTYELGGKGKTSVHLKKLLKQVLTEARCKAYGAETLSQICAGGASGEAACNGDSGGPLTLPVGENGNQFSIIGIVSYGPARCGVDAHPDIYTKVSHYLSFVLDNIQKD